MAKRGFFRDFLGVFNSNIASLLSALLISVLLTRILGAEGYGVFNALVVVPTIVISLTHLGVRGASLYLLGQKKYDENEIVSSVLLILIFSGLLGMVLSLVGYYLFYIPEFSFWLVGIALVVIPFRLSVIYIMGIFLGKDEIREANQMNWTINFLNLLLAVLLVWGLKQGILGAVISVLASNIMVSVYALRKVFKRFVIRLVYIHHIVKHILRLGLLFSITFFVIQLNYKIDIILLEKWSSLSEVGVYSLATQIAEQLWQVPLAIGIVLFSRTANQSDHSGTSSTVLPLTRLTFLVVLGIAAVMYLVAPFVIPFFFGAEFIPSVDMLRLILPGIIVMAVFRVLSGQLEGMGKPQVAIYIFVPALIVNIILNWLWIPEYGGLGAAMASNVSYLLGAIGYWIYYSIINQLGYFELFNFKKSDFQVIRTLFGNLDTNK